MPTAYAKRREQNRRLVELFRSAKLITIDQARLYARNQGRPPGDPLRLKATRAQYLTQLEKRFQRLRSLIERSLARETFGVLATATGGSLLPRGTLGGPADIATSAFLAWLNSTTQDVILDGTGAEIVVPGRQFQRRFTEQAFLRGLQSAVTAAKQAGFKTVDPRQLLGVPRSTEAVELLANRQYQLLIGYTEEMAERQRAILIDGLQNQLSADDIAAKLVDEVGIAENRAKRMARTEMTFAHSEASINAFESMGQTSVEFEFTTTSGAPCPICLDLAGRRYSITAAHGVIPAHPNCICIFTIVETALRQRRAA